MHKVVSKILNSKGFFIGGFVRDYLIRGEKFSDIDYNFHDNACMRPTEKTILLRGKGDVNLADLEQKDYLEGLLFHYCPRSYYYDLSCNLFGFDEDGFFPLPSYHKFDLEKAWELILEKKFYKLCNGKLTINKMLSAKWEFIGEINDRQSQIISHQRDGVWTKYNDKAMERVNQLLV